ncbi:MAG: hypothetical protein MOP51_2546, partial [Citricoccus sp.]|nr:hypothetical protein [Citricoccus sp. WCRC_4]
MSVNLPPAAGGPTGGLTPGGPPAPDPAPGGPLSGRTGTAQAAG